MTSKIAIISTQVFEVPPKGYGGCERVVFYKCLGFKELGYKVTLFAPKGSKVEGVKVVECCEPSFLNPEREAFEIYKDKLYDFDLITDSSWQKWAFYKLEDLRNKIINVLHGPEPFNSIPFEHFNCVCPSKFHAEYTMGRYGIQAKCVYHGFPIDNFKPCYDKEDYFLFASRWSPYKGAHLFIEWCKKYKVKGIMIGDMDFVEDKQYVEKCLKKANKYVEIKGNVDEKERNELMAKAKALVSPLLPPYWEIFGMALCLPPETKIITFNGVKPISQVKVGDLVLTHRGRWRRVTKVFRRWYVGYLIKIKAWGNPTIYLTPEHPVLTICGKVGKFPELRWVEAENLEKRVIFPKPKRKFRKKQYDLVKFAKRKYAYECKKCGYLFFERTLPEKFKNPLRQCPNCYSSKYLERKETPFVEYDKEYIWSETRKNKKIRRIVEIDRDLCYLLGWYIAEGSISASGHVVEFNLGSHEKEYAKEIKRILEDKFGVKAKIREKKSGLIVYTCNSVLPRFFETLCGRGAYNKRIPKTILLHCDMTLLKALVEGTVAGDGGFCNNSYYYHTISPNLAYDMKLALIRLNYRPTINSKTNAGFSNKEVYEVRWAPYNDKKRHHSNKSYWYKNGKLVYFIKEKSKAFYKGWVYNLEVEEDNSYCTTSFVVHNCEAQLFATPVLVTDRGAPREVVKHKVSGWVAKDTFELEQVFEKVAKGVYTFNYEACRKWAEKFDHVNMCRQYIGISYEAPW